MSEHSIDWNVNTGSYWAPVTQLEEKPLSWVSFLVSQKKWFSLNCWLSCSRVGCILGNGKPENEMLILIWQSTTEGTFQIALELLAAIIISSFLPTTSVVRTQMINVWMWRDEIFISKRVKHAALSRHTSSKISSSFYHWDPLCLPSLRPSTSFIIPLAPAQGGKTDSSVCLSRWKVISRWGGEGRTRGRTSDHTMTKTPKTNTAVISIKQRL